jgi:predicted transcriptional regulator
MISTMITEETEYILISLKPQFYQLIMAGKKRHEFRKRFPNKKISAFIYVTQPIGAVKALLEFDKPIREPKDLVGHEGIGVQEFINGQKPGRVALPIKKIHPLKKAVDLSTLKNEFNAFAPQSYIYLHNNPKLLNYLLSLISTGVDTAPHDTKSDLRTP